jgi:hypothetical protein
MKKEKLRLNTIKVKSFTAILPTDQQRTAKGGAAMIDDRIRNGKGSWTEVKSGKESLTNFTIDKRLEKGNYLA